MMTQQNSAEKPQTPRWVVFFDGECGFCYRSVQFILRHDRQHRLCFAPLQGETARCLPAALRSPESLDTLVVAALTSDKRAIEVSTHTEALAAICRQMGGPWKLVGRLIRGLPRKFTTRIYRWVARRRHRLTKAPPCPLPAPAEHNRFLP